jgi:arylsulfatase A-like enzyme
VSKSSDGAQGYSYNADEDSNNSYIDNTQQTSEDKSSQPVVSVVSEQSSDGYSYVDNSQQEDTATKNVSNSNEINTGAVETPGGYSYEHEDSNSSQAVYIDNYYRPINDKKPTKQVHDDDLKKPSPMTSTVTPTPTPMPDMKNWTIDYFSLQNKYVL